MKFYGFKYYKTKAQLCNKSYHIQQKMNSNLTLLQVLLLATTATVFTGAMICKRKIGIVEGTGITNDIMETGRYMVRTTSRTDSNELQDLISLLTPSDIQYKRKSFTAVLQPKDLKKLCYSPLVKSIKEVERINRSYNCGKVIRRNTTELVFADNYIVMMKQGANMSEMISTMVDASNDMNSSVMISSVNLLPFYNLTHLGVMIIRMNSDAVNMMCKQSGIDYIEEDQTVTMTSSTSIWHLDRIDQRGLPLDREYTIPSNGSGVDIYVFDTGINYDHEEFENRAKRDFDPVDSVTGSNQQGRDCNGHGTHVAALVAGKTYGVAKGATVYSTRVLSCSGGGSFVYVLLGINRVIEQQIHDRTRRIIINMSLRGPISQAVDDAISEATKQGILVVVAAGNDFQDACRYSPGSSSDALTVGGTQRNDDLYLRLFDGTNYGRCVDVFAPGQDILSAGIRSNNAVETMSGTSQASPIVSGAAAVYWNMNKTATPLDIKNMITSTCTRNHLEISTAVPSSFADQTSNCLLFIDSTLSTEHEDNLPHYIFYSVPSSQVETYIQDMKESSYALAYISSHLINSSAHYSLIFKYMADVEFVTIILSRLRELKNEVDSYEADGYQLTLIYNMMNSIHHIVVLEKTNFVYSHEFRLTEENYDSLYQIKSSQGDSLLSTTVALTRKGDLRISAIYGQYGMKTRQLFGVSVTRLLRTLNTQRFNQRFYLAHLTTFPTNPPRYAAVFHEVTKSSVNYVMSNDLELHEVEEFVQMQVSKGFTPLVVAGLNTTNGLKFVVSFNK